MSAVRAAVREHVERGCDVIKVMSSGGTMTPGTRQEDAQFDRELLTAVVAEAHRLGVPVTAHAHGTSAIESCLAAGVDGMEHVSFWTADGVDDRPNLRRAIAASGIVVGATAGTLMLPGRTPPAAVLARLPRILANTRHMVELGAVVVVGTDAGIAPVKPHDILRRGGPLGGRHRRSSSELLPRHVRPGDTASCGRRPYCPMDDPAPLRRLIASMAEVRWSSAFSHHE